MSNKKTFRKYAVSTMAAATAATAVVPAAVSADTQKEFPDVSPDNAHKDAIYQLVEEGVITGFEDGTFRPWEEVTRSQVAVMLYELLGLEEPTDVAGALADYKDVDENHRYAKQIAAVTEVGVFHGNTQGNFLPYDNITRQQMATVLVEGLGLKAFDNGENVDINLDKVSADHQDNVQVLANLGVTNQLGDKEDNNFNGYNDISRAAFASMLVLSKDVVEADKDKEPQIESVTALDSKTVRVSFNRPLSDDVTAKNFEVDGDLTATNAELSNDKKSVVVTFNKEFTKDQEYEVTATGLLDENGELYPDTSGKFIWSVAEGVTVSLDSTTIKSGEEIGLTVLDKDGKEVKDAKVKAVSLNTNILESNATSGDVDPASVVLTGGKLGGTVEVEVTTTLPDQSVLRDTFTVTVEEVEPEVTEAGFTFANFENPTVIGENYQYANTAAFELYAPNNTTIVENSENVPFNAFEEIDGNPDVSAVDWSEGDNPATKVETTDSTVATANLNDGNITVDAHKPGETKLIVTLKDGEKKTYDFEVVEEAKFKDIAVGTTSVNLSSESKGGGYDDGVNEKKVNLYTLDQYDERHDLEFAPTDSKVTVSSSSDGIEIEGVNEDGVVTGESITIKALKDEAPVKDAKVKVSYFAKNSDDNPTSTKTINVNVVEVDAEVDASDLDVVVTSEIDANAPNIFIGEHEINYSEAKAYQLDADGNRIGVSDITSVDLETEADDVDLNDTTLVFTKGADYAQTYLRSSGTVTVKVSDGEVSKNLNVGYKNSAVIPETAKVSQKAVSVELKGDDNALTMDQLLFGQADAEQLVLDDEEYSIAVEAEAENDGYKYNKPLVSVTGTNGGETMPLGTNLYGSTTSELENGNLWNNGFINEALLNQDFVTSGFDYDISVTNKETTGNAVVTKDGVTNLASSEDTAKFRVVVKGIYIEGAEKEESNNLLSDSVQFDVSVAGSDE